jgi:hypothetical protein
VQHGSVRQSSKTSRAPKVRQVTAKMDAIAAPLLHQLLNAFMPRRSCNSSSYM